MNYSEPELSNNRTDDERLVQAGVRLLPEIAKALFSAISDLGNDFGLTPAQVKVLLQLGTRRQMTVGEIAAALSCSMPAASELVDRLVDAGHLLRASDPADRRRVLVTADLVRAVAIGSLNSVSVLGGRVLIAPTPASQRISAHLRELREAQVRYALDQLEPEERSTFIKSLEALVTGLTHTQQVPVSPLCSPSLRGSD